jgi:hypothetical protein
MDGRFDRGDLLLDVAVRRIAAGRRDDKRVVERYPPSRTTSR